MFLIMSRLYRFAEQKDHVGEVFVALSQDVVWLLGKPEYRVMPPTGLHEKATIDHVLILEPREMFMR